MKKFSDYTDEELVNIDNETLNKAIRIESIDRGVQPPIPISEALRNSEWVGYQLPADCTVVYRIKCGYHTAQYAYVKRSDAEAALRGVVEVKESSYPVKSTSIQYTDPVIEEVYITVSESKSKASKFEEFTQDNTEFDKIVDECLDRHAKARQTAYNARVQLEKKREYLRLAGGSEEIAKAFWAKTESSSWPE